MPDDAEGASDRGGAVADDAAKGRSLADVFLDDAADTGAVTEFKLDVPNEDFWFDELEFKRREKKEN